MVGWTGRPPCAAWPHFDRMVERRLAGEPLQYVLGRWGFRTLDLLVDRPGADPAARDREGGRSTPSTSSTGCGPTPGDRRAAGGSTWAPGRAPSPCRIAAERRRARGVGHRRVRRRPRRGPGQPGRAGHARRRRVRLAEGSWFEALPDRAGRGRLDLVSATRPTWRRPIRCRPRWPTGSRAGALVAGPTGARGAAPPGGRGARAGWPARARWCSSWPPTRPTPLAAAALDAGFDEVAVRHDLAGRRRALVARLALALTSAVSGRGRSGGELACCRAPG